MRLASLRMLLFFCFFTLVTGPRRSLNLKLSDKRVYEPQIRARLGTTAHFCGYEGGGVRSLKALRVRPSLGDGLVFEAHRLLYHSA